MHHNVGLLAGWLGADRASLQSCLHAQPHVQCDHLTACAEVAKILCHGCKRKCGGNRGKGSWPLYHKLSMYQPLVTMCREPHASHATKHVWWCNEGGYHREAGLLHQVTDGAPQVGNGAASPGGVPLPHGVQPCMLHQQDCICAHCFIELPHLQSPKKSCANNVIDTTANKFDRTWSFEGTAGWTHT